MVENAVEAVRGKYGYPSLEGGVIAWTFPNGRRLEMLEEDVGEDHRHRLKELGVSAKLRGFLAVDGGMSLQAAEMAMEEGFAMLRRHEWRRERSAPGVVAERLARAVREAKARAGMSITDAEAEAKVAAWDEATRRKVLRTYPAVAAAYYGAEAPLLEAL